MIPGCCITYYMQFLCRCMCVCVCVNNSRCVTVLCLNRIDCAAALFLKILCYTFSCLKAQDAGRSPADLMALVDSPDLGRRRGHNQHRINIMSIQRYF